MRHNRVCGSGKTGRLYLFGILKAVTGDHKVRGVRSGLIREGFSRSVAMTGSFLPYELKSISGCTLVILIGGAITNHVGHWKFYQVPCLCI